LNFTEVQDGHLRRINGNHGAQLGRSQLVSLMPFDPFRPGLRPSKEDLFYRTRMRV